MFVTLVLLIVLYFHNAHIACNAIHNACVASPNPTSADSASPARTAWPISDLDYAHYLPVFFDGLREKDGAPTRRARPPRAFDHPVLLCGLPRH
jgi:hypothetical protein